jgi:hypothetical protein
VQLPNAEHAIVSRNKVVDYLLNPSHPDGATKAEFLRRFGFSRDDWALLAEALRRHGRSHPVTKAVASAYGVRYSVDGALETPDGRCPQVRTVWIVERGQDAPRLITADPV